MGYSQKIIIKNFGPISHVELPLNRFSVFFGPQASGKSTLSKSIYFFKSIRDEMYNIFINHIQSEKEKILTSTNVVYKLNNKFKSIFGLFYLHNNFYMEFSYKDDEFLRLKKGNGREMKFEFSNRMQWEITRIISFVNSYKEQKLKERKKKESLKSILGVMKDRQFLSNMKNMLDNLFGDDREVLYIPAGRSLISTLSNKLYLLFQISEYDRNVDYLIREFSEKIMNTRDYFDKDVRELIKERANIEENEDYRKNLFMFIDKIQDILGGGYRFIDGKDRFYMSSKNFIPLNLASSGQQEAVWIIYLMLFYYLEDKDCFIVIEEPEAHLFPKAQRDILRAISLFINRKNNQCIITTHSPYLVSSVNNLLYSKYIYDKYKRINSLIDSAFWIDPNDMVALFLSSGYAQDLLDEETKLLASHHLDSVSDLNSDEFEMLYEIEMEEKYGE
ncbi:AAA family ATPase [Paenibacillus dendritiformis]|uniref:AAA family ATPase n=1 Tax=Paenibacillus dendritiformis TaxID=130049 RepID=UPI0036583F78